jgi:HK97 family phage portal protein
LVAKASWLDRVLSARLKRLFARDPEFTGNLENPNSPLTPSLVWGGSGGGVSSRTAMQVSAVSACVRVLSESVASLSWLVYRRREDGGKDRAKDHSVYSLLHTRPNPYMSSFQFRERLMRDVLLEGNHYSEIQFTRSGEIGALWPLVARNTELVMDSTPHYVTTTKDRGRVPLPYEVVFHVPGLGDGYVGESVIKHGARVISLASAQDDFTEEFFDNGSTLSGVLESKKGLSPAARTRLQAGWAESNVGRGQRHKTPVLEDEVTWKSTGVTPEDAQILQERRFSTEEIARLFRVPLHMIGNLERATFSNIEHLAIEFVVHSLRPWLVRIEQVANYKLFLPFEWEELFSEFLIDSLLRGDIVARNQALHLQRQDGIINADEWREIENRNPQPDGQGKQYLVNSTMGVPGAPAKATESTRKTEQADTAPTGGDADLKGQFDAYGIAVRSGSITPQPEDEVYFRQRAELPPMSSAVLEAWKADAGVRRPVTLVQKSNTEPPAPPADKEGAE